MDDEDIEINKRLSLPSGSSHSFGGGLKICITKVKLYNIKQQEVS